MSGERTITFGSETMTVKAWSARLGMPRRTLEDRVKRWGVDRAITTPWPAKTPAYNPNRYEWNGERLTIPEWSQKLGISVSTIQTRISRGYELEWVFSADRHTKRAKGRKREFSGPPEYCCLRCTVEPDCNEDHPDCKYPRTTSGEPVSFKIVMQNHCGFREKTERGVTCR